MDRVDARRLRGDRSRAKILMHSAWIASKDGLEGISLGRVASEAGVGKANVQALFGDKESLQYATLEKAVELFQSTVIFPAMNEKTPLTKLLALVEGWFNFVDKRVMPGGCFIHAVSSEYRGRPGRIRDRIVEHRVSTRDRYRNLIVEAKEAGELSADLDVEQLVFDLVASESVANVAALLEDDDEFKRAWASSIARVKAYVISSPKRSRRGMRRD